MGSITSLSALQKYQGFIDFECLGKDDECWETCVSCKYEKATYPKVNQLRYDPFSQKYQGTLGQALNAFDDIFFLLVKL